MAITKTCKNMTVTVNETYNLNVGGKLEKITNKMNVEATKENMSLSSNKTITSIGGKK